MSRDLEDTDYYVSSGGIIPLKWTAPEAIHYKKYSTASHDCCFLEELDTIYHTGVSVECLYGHIYRVSWSLNPSSIINGTKMTRA